MTPAVHVRLDLALDHLRATTLDEMQELAALHTRVDRKYVLTPETMGEVLAALGAQIAILQIDFLRSFRYQSLYFDTDDQLLYRAAAHGRSRRFKVRTRHYLDTGTCALEVKSKSGRRETVKERLPYDVRDREQLTATGRQFVDDRTGHERLGDALTPQLTTEYLRSTLVDETNRTRATIDRHVTCTACGGAETSLDGFVIFETKSSAKATRADRWLWRHGHRPVTISKFCAGMAVLHPALPANRWNRVLNRYPWITHPPGTLHHI